MFIYYNFFSSAGLRGPCLNTCISAIYVSQECEKIPVLGRNVQQCNADSLEPSQPLSTVWESGVLYQEADNYSNLAYVPESCPVSWLQISAIWSFLQLHLWPQADCFICDKPGRRNLTWENSVLGTGDKAGAHKVMAAARRIFVAHIYV